MSGSVVVDERPGQTADTPAADAPSENGGAPEAAIEVEVPAPKLISIVGYTESKKEAPWGDPTWERWLCNDLIRFCPNDWHRLYDVHSIKDIKADTAHDAFLKGGSRTLEDGSKNTVALDGRPVYVMKTSPDWPTAIEFPKDDAIEAFGDYFTNSISWMVAHAMMEIRSCAVQYAEANLAAMATYAEGQGKGATDFCKQASVGLYDALIRQYEATCAIHVYGVDMATGCLAPETKVLTADLKWIRSDEVREGMDLLAFDEDPATLPDGKSRRRRWRKTQVSQRDDFEAPRYRVNFEDGTSVVATAEHKWLTYAEHIRRWKRTDELVTATHRPDRPTRVVKPLDVWESTDCRMEGYVAGAFDGEGWVSQNATQHANTSSLVVGFAQRENELSETVLAELDRRGFDYGVGKDKHSDCLKYNIRGGRRSVMRFLGEVRPSRLLRRFDCDLLGEMRSGDYLAVVSVEPIGDGPVIGLRTGTGTLVAEGLASHNSEYANQRPSVEFILGIAQGRGIKTHVPLSSDLLKITAMYGAENDSAMYAKFTERKDELTKRAQQLQANIEQAQTQFAQIQGALETTNYVLSVWCNPRGTRDGTATTAPAQEPEQLQEAA